MNDEHSDGQAYTFGRRQVLKSAGGVAAAAALGSTPGTATATLARTMIVPTVEVFADNYTGQFLAINDRDVDREIDPAALEDCSAGWSSDETQVYDGQLLDRRSEEPLAVQVPVFADDQQADVAEGTLFIIDGASQCGDYVSLDAVSVPTRSLVGEPPGPTVTESGGGGVPGFGVVLGGLGIAGGAIARSLWKRRGE